MATLKEIGVPLYISVEPRPHDKNTLTLKMAVDHKFIYQHTDHNSCK
jgi:hypothetical protein